MYPNRTLCSVLSEARKCWDTRNFSYLLGLIEEAQAMGNRMEAALEDKADLRAARKQLRDVRKEIELLEAKRDELKEPPIKVKTPKAPSHKERMVKLLRDMNADFREDGAFIRIEGPFDDLDDMAVDCVDFNFHRSDDSFKDIDVLK